MIRSTFNFLLALISVAAIATSSSESQAAEKFDLASAWPAGNFHVKNAMRFAEEVNKATKGEVTITVHPGGALGLRGPEKLVAVRNGVVQMADIQMNQQVGENVFWGIESLPFLAVGYEELKALQKHTRPIFDKLAADYNQKILYIVPWPPQNVFAKVAADTSSDQMKGVKIRTIDKNASEFFQRLGATAIQMPWGEVIPALATGTLNAVSTSSSSGVDGKFWEFMSHLNRWQWQMNSQMVTVNLAAWKRLKPETQKEIEEVARRLEPEFWSVSRAEDDRNIKLLTDNRMTVVEPTQALKAQIATIGASMWEEYAKSAGPSATNVLGSYRKEVGK
jgi:TRAP-type transport system periplasmic protein